MAKSKPTFNKTIGNQGESWVTKYLVQKGYQIIDRNWHSARGEIDIIAFKDNQVVFIEVKTRQTSGLDRGGLLAINASKQQKIIATAQAFLARYPQWWDYPCCFDVVLVKYQPNGEQYHFKLVSHLEAAFIC